jgi:type IV pilus assembly protein PilV
VISNSQLFSHKSCALSAQAGVGMVEILITLFILSIGMLGVASLQFVSAFANADALNRSQSVMVVQQFGERLRVNAVKSATGDGLIVDNAYFNANLYNFNNLACAGGGSAFECFCLGLPLAIPNCRANECSAAEFAAYDAYELSCSATSSNPAASIGLSCTDNNLLDADSCSVGSRHRIILTWPVESWQNNNRILNPICNVGAAEPKDCVALDVTI